MLPGCLILTFSVLSGGREDCACPPSLAGNRTSPACLLLAELVGYGGRDAGIETGFDTVAPEDTGTPKVYFSVLKVLCPRNSAPRGGGVEVLRLGLSDSPEKAGDLCSGGVGMPKDRSGSCSKGCVMRS